MQNNPGDQNPKLECWFSDTFAWHKEAVALRKVLRQCDLKEGIKWCKPSYTRSGKNICIMQRMRQGLALMFYQVGQHLVHRVGVDRPPAK